MNLNLKTYYYIILIVLAFVSCSKTKEKQSMSYFGGQIVNPKSSKVYFLKNGKHLDSAKLNKHSKFLFKFKNLNPGLYTFSNGSEYQYIYFNTNDSIIIRLNTWDFDESLVFSGKGAERNNFLISLFLNNENEDKIFSEYYKLDPKTFDKKIDSALKQKTTLFKQFKSNNKNNPNYFNKLVQVAISYPLYRKKENYAIYHKRKLKANNYPLIESSFYAYRKKVNLNDSSLVYFYPYRNYVNSFLHHNAYLKKSLQPNTNIALNIINNVIETIHQKELKNFFLYRVISDSFFYYDVNDTQRKDLLKLFYENCDNDKLVSEIKQLAFDFGNIKKGAKLFDFELINTNGVVHNSSTILKHKKTVLYFWSKKLINVNNLSKRILYLKKTYPNLRFIGINMDYHRTTWLKSPIFNKLSPKNQFQLSQKCEMRKFLTAKVPRIILLDNNTVVKNGFTVFWAENFDADLKELNKN